MKQEEESRIGQNHLYEIARKHEINNKFLLYLREMKNLIFNMSGEPVEGVEGAKILDFSSLEGTNCYCDAESAEQLRKALAQQEDMPGINWIDTGDYHYISALTTERIEEDYILVVFDHHPDMQEPMAKGMLSCGNWAREAFIKQAKPDAEHINRGHMKQLLLVGINPGLELEFLDLIMDDVLAIDENEFKDIKAESFKLSSDSKEMLSLLDPKLPIYISLDLDVLVKDYARTNWDQGKMGLDELKCMIHELTKGRKLIGADICGGLSASKGGTEKDNTINAATRAELQKYFGRII